MSRPISFGAIAISVLCAAATADDAIRAFEEGRTLIEANHPEKESATREGMLKGAIRAEEAIALGLSDRYRAWMLIGYAYSQVGLSAPPSDGGADVYLQRSRSAYASALAIRPGDAEALRALAGVQSDHPSRVASLRALVRAAPEDDTALLLLGRLLIEGDPARSGERSRARDTEFQEGVAFLKRSAQVAPSSVAKERRGEVASILRAHGRTDDAKQVERLRR